MRMFLFLLLFISPMFAWACDNKHCEKSQIQNFSFSENDLISWTPSTVEISSTYNGKDQGIRKENTILFHFEPSKAQELVKLTEKIADPINTDNNLAIFFKDQLISELRIPTPLPEMSEFHLKISDEKYQHLTKTLPQEKMIPKNNN